MSLINRTIARNIYYGGGVFFILLFIALTFDTTRSLPKRVAPTGITPEVARGKAVWEKYDCIGCHTLLGEGAYFAPELGNIYQRRGSAEFIKAWVKAQPTNIPGRRQMPRFDISDEDLNALAEFLKWSSEVNTAKWPPNVEG